MLIKYHDNQVKASNLFAYYFSKLESKFAIASQEIRYLIGHQKSNYPNSAEFCEIFFEVLPCY